MLYSMSYWYIRNNKVKGTIHTHELVHMEQSEPLTLCHGNDLREPLSQEDEEEMAEEERDGQIDSGD